MAVGGDSTEFTAKITVDSKQAEQNVQNLGDQTEDTAEKFVSLKTQIRQTTVELQKLETEGKTATKEFEKLRSKLDDLNDAQERAAFKAGQFDDKLAALPGPLGQAGGALKTFNESVNQFGKTLTLSLGLVGLVVTAFLAIKNALEKTEKGQKLLSQATEAFNKILAPVFVILQKMGEFVLPTIIKGFELVGKAVGKVASIFGDNKDRIKEMNAALQENNEYANDLAAKEKKRADDAKALADKKKAEQDKRDAEEKARQEKLKAAREKAAAEQAEFDKARVQAAIELLDGQEKEQAALAVKYAEERLKYKGRSAKDLAIFDEQYQKQRLDIEKKYADEKKAKDQKDLDDQVKALDDFYKEQEEKQKKKNADARQLSFEEVQDQIAALDKKNAEVEGDFAADLARLEQKKTLLEQQKQIELSNTELTAAEKLKISRDYADKEAAIEKDLTATKKAETEARQAINTAYLGLAQQFGNALTQMAGENKELAIAGVVISQAAAIGQIISQTAIANAKSVAASPLTGGMPWVAINTISAGLSIATTIAGAIKSIQQINAAPGPSGGGGGGSVGGAPSIQAPRVGTAATPVMAEGVGQNPSSQIAQTIGNASKEPVRAYVVSQDITSQQMLDRKVNASAVF